MKIPAIIFFGSLLVLLFPGGYSTMHGSDIKNADSNPSLGKVRHVVLFKFKDGTTPQQVRTIEQAFGKLRSQIKEIRDYEWGTNNSPEGLNQGLTHCFLVTFDAEKDRDAYLPHPAHKAFVEILKPHLDKVTVVDYIAQP